VSRDEVTIRLLEATPTVKQRYVQQARRSPVDFLFKALEIGSACDLAYKSSKNQRLHVELSLIRLCRITNETGAEVEKKKPDTSKLKESSEEIRVPPKSEILRHEADPDEKKNSRPEQKTGKTDPAVETDTKSFSIKNIISEESEPYEKRNADPDSDSISKTGNPQDKSNGSVRDEFSQEKFMSAWKDFTEEVQSDSPRVASMFKSIIPEFHSDNSIVLHLSNADQKDMFAQNYKQKLTNFLNIRFGIKSVDIEVIVDLSQTDGIIYSDEQKYNHLTSKYPELKDIRKAFNLDFE
jgi:DNA polymerase-3 subunit gamma/tau